MIEADLCFAINDLDLVLNPKSIPMLLPPNKGKGVLVFLYLIISVFICAIISGAILRRHPEYDSPYEMYFTMGIAVLLSSLAVHFTHKDYYRDKEGNKVFFEMEHHLLYIKMKYWVYIYLALGVVLIGNVFFHYFPPGE